MLGFTKQKLISKYETIKKTSMLMDRFYVLIIFQFLTCSIHLYNFSIEF